MKATRKLIPAIAMLLVSLAVMSTASFAWFTMSRQVTAQGMNVSVVAPNNLMIKLSSDDASKYAELATDENLGGAILAPASTVDGATFYVVKDGESVVTNTGALKADTELVEITSSNNGTVYTAYHDFVFTIKSDGDANVDVVVNKIEVTDGGTGKSLVPVRVAVICGSTTKLFKPSETAVHHESGKAVSGLDSSNCALRDTVTYTPYTVTNSTTDKIVTLSGGTEQTVTIRVWFEGEDTLCTAKDAAKAQFNVTVTLADAASLPSGS